jgi:hypothetical protein
MMRDYKNPKVVIIGLTLLVVACALYSTCGYSNYGFAIASITGVYALLSQPAKERVIE